MVPGNLRAANIVVKFYAMKTTFRFLLLALFLTGAVMPAQSQLLKRLKDHAKEKINNEAESRAERRIDRGVDKVYDKIEDKIDGKDSPKGDETQTSDQQEARSGSEASGRAANEAGNTEDNAPKDAALNWSRYDFVPGDVVIFEDGPSQDEENGEFPSRWDLVKGQVEIAEVDGEKVMMFISGQPTIVPYLKDSDKDYLPMCLPLNSIFTNRAMATVFPFIYSTIKINAVFRITIPLWKLKSVRMEPKNI